MWLLLGIATQLLAIIIIISMGVGVVHVWGKGLHFYVRASFIVYYLVSKLNSMHLQPGFAEKRQAVQIYTWIS